MIVFIDNPIPPIINIDLFLWISKGVLFVEEITFFGFYKKYDLNKFDLQCKKK